MEHILDSMEKQVARSARDQKGRDNKRWVRQYRVRAQPGE
jgi:hypothetical protein